MWFKYWLMCRRSWLAALAALACWYWFARRFCLALGSRRRLLRLAATLAPAVWRHLPKRLSAKTQVTVVPPRALEQTSIQVAEIPALALRRWLLLPTTVEPIEEQFFDLTKPDQWSSVAALLTLGLDNQSPWLQLTLLEEANECVPPAALFLIRREVTDEALAEEFTRRRLRPVNFSSLLLFLQLQEVYWPKNSRIFAVGNHALSQRGEWIALCATQGHMTLAKIKKRSEESCHLFF